MHVHHATAVLLAVGCFALYKAHVCVEGGWHLSAYAAGGQLLSTQSATMLTSSAQWTVCVVSVFVQPDASSWLDGSGTPSECSMRVLTVPDRGTTIINGSLPSGFDEGHNPRFWVLEFIAKVRKWCAECALESAMLEAG